MDVNQIKWVPEAEHIQVDGVPDHCYGPYEHIRLIHEDHLDSNGDWGLDAIDGQGNYSEDLWIFTSFEAAVAAIPGFNNEVAKLDGPILVEYDDYMEGVHEIPDDRLAQLEADFATEL